MKKTMTAAIAAFGIMAMGTATATACPQHKHHARAHHGHNTYYTGNYSYSQPVAYNYGYHTPGYHSMPYTHYNSGWTNDWSGQYRGDFGVNTGFGFFGF